MKVSRTQAAANRDRVVEVAGRLLRENGFDGIGVDGLMQEAGLTHGGFYKSFGSKEGLTAEACAQAMTHNAAHRAALIDEAGKNALAALVNDYLSVGHRDRPGSGCAFAALATDAARRSTAVRSVFTHGLQSMVDQVVRITPGRAAKRRDAALATIAGLVGALILARAVDDPELSRDLLAAGRRALGGNADAGDEDPAG